MNKSLLRQDGVADSDTSLDTQSSTVTFKKGKAIDFGKLAKAVDSAGFKAAEIKIWARGTVERSDGQLALKVSGTGQTLLLKGDAADLRTGQEVRVVGNVEFDKKPSILIVERVEK